MRVTHRQQLIAGILIAPEGDMPDIIAAAIAQYCSTGKGITQLLIEISLALGTMDDAELRDEFLMALEDWEIQSLPG